MAIGRGRPKKLRQYEKLTKEEKEVIMFEWEHRGGKEKPLSTFAHEQRLSPLDFNKLLRTYEISYGEDVNNELKSILNSDNEIVKRSQEMIMEWMAKIEQNKNRKQIGIKEIETLLKAADNALKRTTLINKVIEDREEKRKGNKNNAPLEIKLTL